MNVLVMGAGAIGCVVGGLLSKAGHRVTLVGRAAPMEAVRENGLDIRGIWGEHHVEGLTTVTSPKEAQPSAFDVILITVKSYDTAEAARAITPLVGPNTLVCSYQNGLGNAEAIAEAVGWPQTIGARAIYGVWMPELNTVEVTVIAQPTAIGTYDEATPTDPVKALVQAMDTAGLPTVYTENIRTVLWNKVAYNCALNPLSALLDIPYGGLLDTEDTRAMLKEIVRELYAVADAMKVALDPPGAEAYIDLLFHTLIPPTANHYASMREDFRRSKKTEIDALNGAIVRYGEEYDVPTPTNTTLTRLIKAKEAGYRS